VSLTRRLNACGYATLRFDLSGLGDSGVDGSPRSRQEQVSADISAAMRLLAAHAGCTRFVLVGLCSGAANAHGAAREHAEVAGAVFLDGYAYRTHGFRMRHYFAKLIHASPGRLIKAIFRRIRPRSRVAADPLFEVGFPPRREVATDLLAMLGRGLNLFFVFSGGASGYFNHLRQFRECYGAIARHPGIEVRYFDGADHTYVLGADRAMLVDAIAEWMRRKFPD
jgi:pimeloyl-ACP methyl ester carboxylesterase